MITVIISIIVMSTLIIFESVIIKKKYFENEVFAMSSNYQLKEIENNEYNIKNIIEENTKDSRFGYIFISTFILVTCVLSILALKQFI